MRTIRGTDMRRNVACAAGAIVLALLAGCGDRSLLPFASTTGPNPTLPPPRNELIRTVNVAEAKGWPAQAAPASPQGLKVRAMPMDTITLGGFTCRPLS